MKGISVLLSRTEGPVNLGFIARAMANTGFSDLAYTGEIPSDHEKAKKYAIHAENILSCAKHAASFDSLISDSDIVIGFTPRSPFSSENLSYENLTGYVHDCLAKGQSVGLLFGNEKSGLDNTELSACARIVSLPTSSEYVSMNLAQAVLVVLWELKEKLPDKNLTSIYADRETKDLLSNKLREYLELIDFLNGQNPENIWQELRHTIESKDLTAREAELLLAVVGKSISRFTFLSKNTSK